MYFILFVVPMHRYKCSGNWRYIQNTHCPKWYWYCPHQSTRRKYYSTRAEWLYKDHPNNSWNSFQRSAIWSRERLHHATC